MSGTLSLPCGGACPKVCSLGLLCLPADTGYFSLETSQWRWALSGQAEARLAAAAANIFDCFSLCWLLIPFSVYPSRSLGCRCVPPGFEREKADLPPNVIATAPAMFAVLLIWPCQGMSSQLSGIARWLSLLKLPPTVYSFLPATSLGKFKSLERSASTPHPTHQHPDAGAGELFAVLVNTSQLSLFYGPNIPL